ncbi:SLC13 family permease [Cloacibacillus evryensis]|uniref:SLC13 family permease n=1 Tax=Cloacibacillus evryensis TaxID=508460 RepID=UPI002671F14D|nr:SLC13 family permease [Cloacibacillus evryensis]
MFSVLVILAIVVSVAISYKTKYNIGIFAISFAYLIGCFGLGLSPKNVINMWPTSTVFVILSVSLFYNFALINGTLEKVARYILYIFKKPSLLPFALWFATVIIAALGAGFFTAIAFMAPIGLMICKEAKFNKMVGAVAIVTGASSGATFVTSGTGVVCRQLMENQGIDNNIALTYTLVICLVSLSFSLIAMLAFYFKNRHDFDDANSKVFEQPESLDKKQKLNLALMLLMLAVVLVFPLLHLAFPGIKAFAVISKKLDVGLVATVFAVAALLLKLAPQKKVLDEVPWSTIMMVAGVGMLIGVAIEAGTIKLLAVWISSSVPVWLIPITITVVAAFMSFFSSTLGVVCPALFPLVSSLAEATGINPMVLFACILVGAQSSSISPFSAGGSLMLGACEDEGERATLFPKLIFQAIPTCIASAVVANVVFAILLW